MKIANTFLHKIKLMYVPKYFGIIGVNDKELNIQLHQAASACVTSMGEAAELDAALNAVRTFLRTYWAMPDEVRDPYSDSNVFSFVQDCCEALDRADMTTTVWSEQ